MESAPSPSDRIDLAQWTALSDQVPVGLCLVDAAGRFAAVNAAYCALYGYARADLLGQPIDLVVPPEDAAAARAALAQVLRGAAPPPSTVTQRPRRHRDGTPRWVEGGAARVPGPDGAPLALFAITDITARTVAEAALREASAHNRSLIEANLDAMVFLDLEGRITDLNRAAEALLGRPRAEVLGAETWAFLTNGDEARATSARILVDGQLCDYPTGIRHKDGHTTPVLSNITLHRDAAGAVVGFLAVSRDITAQKQLEAERLLRSKLEATGHLAAGIAHDFNNLLSIVLGSLELLSVTPAAERAVLRADMRAAIAQAQALTQQFLAFAKGGSGLRQSVAVAALCQDAVGPALHGSAVTATVALPPTLWAVQGDPGQLGQVLRNLCLNAREAMPYGGQLTLTAENCPGPSPQVRLTLTDPGVGIPPERLPRVFDPYFSSKQRGGQRGMGLGLTVARSIVEQHGGTLALSSTVGVGTTVQITLPAVLPAPAP